MNNKTHTREKFDPRSWVTRVLSMADYRSVSEKFLFSHYSVNTVRAMNVGDRKMTEQVAMAISRYLEVVAPLREEYQERLREADEVFHERLAQAGHDWAEASAPEFLANQVMA